MNPERVGEAMAVRQRAHAVEVEHRHRGQHDLRHAGVARALNHRVTIGVELGRVEVTVGVDPAHCEIMPSFEGPVVHGRPRRDTFRITEPRGASAPRGGQETWGGPAFLEVQR